MPLKDLALLMTVGTGIGSEEKRESLAHGFSLDRRASCRERV